MRERVFIAALALTLGSPGLVRANGRFPDAQQLVVNPTNANDIAVQTTYGFIHTVDGGAIWTWTCEESTFYGGQLDPPIALLGDGTLIAGVFDGLVVSSPDKCDYRLVEGGLVEKFVVDVSAIKGESDRAIVLYSNGVGGSEFDTRVYASDDGAATWAQRGASLPPSFLGLTLDAAPSDPSRLYVSGFDVVSSNDYVGVLGVSEDAGATWTLRPVPDSANDSGPFLAAIDPGDPDVAYVRLASLAGTLLVTRDAGVTWEVIFEGAGPLLGFALSPDGTKLWVGGPDDGIWLADTATLAFEQVNELGVRCLTSTSEALFACGREAFADFTIGKSLDDGATFTPIHNLSCLYGPDEACSAESDVRTVCEGPWAAQKQILKTEECIPEGTGGAGGGAGGGDGGGGGCACGTPRATGSSMLSSSLWAALGLALVRRRLRASWRSGSGPRGSARRSRGSGCLRSRPGRR